MDKSQVLRTVKDIELRGKNVLIRLDMDVPIEKSKIKNQKSKIADDTRLVNTLPTVKYLLDKEAKVTIIGHLGRPEQRTENRERRTENREQRAKWSMEPVRKWYREKLKDYQNWELWENLRFDPGEEANSLNFAENIVRRSEAKVFVFEAFATAHEPHASVISVPKLVSGTAVGFRFLAEIQNLSKIWQNPKRPVVFMLGGAKVDTKLGLIPKLAEQADEVLIGGLLPTKLGLVCLPGGGCITAAELTDEGFDITEESAKMFADKIMSAGTAVWNGPMGAFEKGADGGTRTVAKAMRETGAFTAAGGGDTEAALSKLGGSDGIDWISSGGGAMLYFLAHHTFPFLEAIRS